MIYVNGVAQSLNTMFQDHRYPHLWVRHTAIGRAGSLSANYFNGLIDEVAFTTVRCRQQKWPPYARTGITSQSPASNNTAFDAASDKGSVQANVSSITGAYHWGGSNRVLVVGVGILEGAGTVPSGVTYNGVAMTEATSARKTLVLQILSGIGRSCYGTNDVAVTFSVL